ncbi:MAG TPA: choice-of-anchor C family protein [Gemmataceae bacterium]|nr:choice-of-anchor C family protein [Gemmataceae bacterium]
MSAAESRSAVVLQLAEEFLERYRQGQRPSLKEYIDRHPELAAEIKEVFPAMALMENVALDDESLAGDATGPATPTESTPPAQLGDYRILREVGRGGMGIVYEAEQVSLGRHVALKVLPRKVLLDDAQKRRFEREAKAAAKLHHTNIVPVFGVGEHDGLPYYVMQFIQGLGLDDVLDELKRMQGSGTATTGGELRVARKDVSAADVARSLLTGAFADGERGASASRAGGVSPLNESRSASQGADAPPSGESKLSDSFTVSSAVKLPGSGTSAHSKGKKASYWQSVAQVGVQVAEALEYAHKQGIQHRDIKPSNLLLDTRGTVWVTDFGLARADNEDHLTQTGDIVGTLRYMPPEAFEGRADKRGDVYSLGLTMYELLAFKPAYEERDRHRLIKRVTTEEPPRLDKLSRPIPRDLVTIIHKAIDREPGRRYQTAGELAGDLQRFLDDEPIQARPISSAKRLLRWCRHHPGVATLTAALAVILLGVTVASLIAAARFDRLAWEQAAAAENERAAAENERQARREADEAKDHEAGLRKQAEEAKKQAEEAKKQAENNLREAERQKERAESNFTKARKAVDDYFTSVSESQLLTVPGMQPLRRDLLQSALAFYQDFLKERGDDPALRGELAAAFLRVGKIRSELGEGAEAHKAYEQARELYAALTKAAPESAEWRHGLAQCYYRLSRYDDAIALWEKLVQPGQPRYQKELADAYNDRGSGHLHAGRLAEALQDHQKALTIREMLVRLNPDDADAQRDLGGTLNNIGTVLGRKGRQAEALAMYRRAAEHAEVSFAQAPQVILNGRYLAIQQNNIARIEQQLGHSKEALAAYQRVVEVWRQLARDNPAVANLPGSLVGAYRYLALYQRRLKQTEEAARTMRLAREAIERLPSDTATDLYYAAWWRAICLPSPAKGKEKPTTDEQAEQKREADLVMESLRQAVAAGFRDLEGLRKNTAMNPLRSRDDFKAVEADLAALVKLDYFSERLKARQDALALHQKLAQADPKNMRLQAIWAASLDALASIQNDLGNVEEAEKSLEQAVALQEKLIQEEPMNALYQTELAASRLWLHLASARRLTALKRTKEAEAVLSKIDEFKPSNPALWLELGRIRLELDQWDKAAQDYRQAVRRQPFTNVLNGFDYGYILLGSGEGAGYRQACRDMLYRFGRNDEPHGLNWTIRTCILDANAVADSSQIVEAARKALKAFPGHSGILFALAAAHYRAGQLDEAIKQAEESLNTKNRLDGDDRVLAWLVLAMAQQRKGQPQAARKWLEQAAHWLDDNSEGQPRTKTMWRNWLIARRLRREAEELLAPKVAQANRIAAAADEPDKLEASRQALARQQKLAADDPKNKRLQADLAASQHSIALVQLGLGKPEEAHKHLQQAITLREALVKDEPNTAQYQTDLALSRFALGDIYWKTDRLREGERYWRQLLAALEESLQRDKANAALKQQLAALHRQIGDAYADLGLWREAAAEQETAFALQPGLADGDTWFGRAALALQLGKPYHFRRICQDFLKLPSSSEHSHWTARLNMLAAGAYTDPALAVTAAQQEYPMVGKHWHLFVSGAAHYRTGHYAESERVLRASMDPKLNPRYLSHRWFWLALIYQSQGKTEEAKQWLRKGVQWMEHGQHKRQPEGGPDNTHWYQALELHLLRREAEMLIDGAAAPEPMDVVLKRAQAFVRLDQPKKAEADFQAVVLARPNDASIWLTRGRVFAQLGQRGKADADFAKAATLTPEELDRFPQAGWWVVGPYPEDLKQPCPPEKGPDPSRPVAAVGSADQLHWRPAPTESDGRLRLWSIFATEHISAYALTYVYSPDERTATLLVGGDDRVRVWLNGRLVHETNRTIDDPWGLDRVPVTLKAGRNTLLCKISQKRPGTNTGGGWHFLYLRIADNPLDRALLHAPWGLWDEAAIEFARGIDRQPLSEANFYCRCAHAQMVVGDTAGYRRYVDRMFEHFDGNSASAFWLAYAGGLLDGAVKPARLVELAESYILNDSSFPYYLHSAGIAHYRAGQFDKAIERLEQSLKNPGWQSGAGHASELGLALVHHRLGHAKESRQWLDKAEQWYDKAIQDALASPTGTTSLYNWGDWPSFVVLRREAHKLILGRDLPDDPRLKKLADRLRDRLKKLDKATAEYDEALLVSSNEPRLWLVRARRLAELKRDKEAAADFAKALELLPGDADSLRREIYAELDHSDQLRSQVVALRPKDDKLAAFLRARKANARGSGPAGIVVPGNLLKNGGFEDGPYPGNYRLYQTDSTELPGWTIFRGNVEVLGFPWYRPSQGTRCLDLDGHQPGGIRQTVPTKVGQKYRLLFDLAGNPYWATEKRLLVQAAGQSADFAFDVTGRSDTCLGWVRKQWEFTAIASRTTVEFISLDKEGGGGPFLDNIALVPVSGDEKKK